MASSATGWSGQLRRGDQLCTNRAELESFSEFLKKAIPQLLRLQDTCATCGQKREKPQRAANKMGKSRRHSRKLFRFFSCLSDKSGDLSSDDILTSSPFPSSKTSSKECEKCSQFMVCLLLLAPPLIFVHRFVYCIVFMWLFV